MAGPNLVYYAPIFHYFQRTRLLLQDLVTPYRYSDDTLEYCLNGALVEIMRIRPDIFLDAKYQAPLHNGDLARGYEGVTFGSDPNATGLIPVPLNYAQPLLWYAAGTAQLLDVTDTQDQRGGAFMAKFTSAMLSMAA